MTTPPQIQTREPSSIPRLLDPLCDGYPNGPERILLIGPPGTGKSYSALTHWVLPAIQSGVPPHAVLATTFTRAGAYELRARISAATSLTHVQVGRIARTVHSECFHLCDRPRGLMKTERDEEEDELDAVYAFEVMEEQRRELEKEALRVWDKARNMFPEVARENRTDAIDGVLRTEGNYTFLPHHIHSAIDVYEKSKERERLVDFTDLLFRALVMEPRYREVLVVDEGQDISNLQILLIKHWAQAAKFLVVIGDGDQSIYGWRGASGALLREMEATAEIRRLGVSRRVPRAPHALACRLIAKNRNRLDSPYESNNSEGEVRAIINPAAVFSDIESSVNDGRSVFVLARSRTILDGYADVLADRGLPFLHERGASPLGARRLVDALGTMLYIRTDEMVAAESALRLVNFLPGRPAKKWFSGSKTTCLETIKLSVEAGEFLDVRALRNAGVNTGRIVEQPLPDVFRDIGPTAYRRVIPLLHLLERWGRGVLGPQPPIVLTTFHGSKGREAHLVVVDLTTPKLVEGELLLPSASRDEERRNLYVAITRTLDKLVLVRTMQHFNLGRLLGLG